MSRLFKRGRIWYTHVYEDGRRIQKSTRCRDKAAADAVARRFEREAADPDHARAAKATLTDALSLLIRTREEQARAGRRSHDTVAFYKSKAGHLVRLLEHDSTGCWEPLPLLRLHARTVDHYISCRRSEGASDHTISKELVTLRAALKLAKRAGLWHGDVAQLLPVAFAPEYKPRQRALTREEAQKLLGQLTSDKAARVAFILATSACWSETERAERSHVARDLSSVEIRGTKRATRQRTVPIVTARQKALLQYAMKHAQGGPRLFRGWPNVRRDLEQACERARIPKVTPNDLRRTFSRWMRAERVPLELIAPLMGHSTTKMVEVVYGKLPPDELAEQIRACITGASQPMHTPVMTAFPAPRGVQILSENAAESVPRGGIEPPTRGFSILCSTN